MTRKCQAVGKVVPDSKKNKVKSKTKFESNCKEYIFLVAALICLFKTL